MGKFPNWFLQVCFLFFLLLTGNQTAHSQISPVEIDGGFIGLNPTTHKYQFYHSTASPSQVLPVQAAGNSGGKTIWYINGIRTDAEAQFFTMKKIARISGQPVIGIRNTTDGVYDDFVQAKNDVIERSRKNPSTPTLARALYNELKLNRDVHLIAHSQGTAIVAVAIDWVKEKFEQDKLSFCEVLEKLSLIKAEIYGSPVYEFTSGPSYYHRCNYEDLVCNSANYRYLQDMKIDAFEYINGYGSEIRGNIYGGKAFVRHINVDVLRDTPDHDMNTIYLDRRPSQILFPIPPKCHAKVFLMDTSGSMAEAGKWDGALQSVLDSLIRLEESSNDQSKFFLTSVLSFAGECSENSAGILFDFTTDIPQISSKLGSVLPRPNGGTPLFISKGVAQKMLDEYLKKNPSIVQSDLYVLSDGEDTCNQIRPSGIYGYGSSKNFNSSSKSKTYTIGYDLAPGSKGERDLQYMAFVGGGKYYNAADPRQLKRAFQKLTQSYFPKIIALTDSQLLKFNETLSKAELALQKKQAVEAVKLYRQLEADFKRDAIVSSELYFNLAQSLEANDRYRSASEYYQLYLRSNPQAADKVLVEQKIATLKQDYKDQFEYYLKTIESDTTYLKNFYKDLYNKQNSVLAAEFAGFVVEKGEFYANLQDVLEVKAKWLENGSKGLSDSLYNLSDRVDKPSFDRDAVSLLTLPISQLEEILELLNKDKVKFMSI